MRRTAEHQMLETNGQSRYARDARRAHRHRKRCSVPPSACWYPRSVPAARPLGETMLIYLHTCVTGRDSLPKGLTQFCLSVNHSHLLNLHILFRTVAAVCLYLLYLIYTSMPSTTSPNTVYSPSRCGVPPTVVYAFTCSGVKRNSGSPAT